MKKRVTIAGIVLMIVAGALNIPVGNDTPENIEKANKAKSIDMQRFSTDKPDRSLNILLIHHSTGGQLLASVGPDVGQNCIYQTHPNGGGLRDALTEQGYAVHEVSYGSELGEKTDIFDWLPKFKNAMDKVLTASGPDTYYSGDTKNSIVAFKSCFPNNLFTAAGTMPGNAAGPELTVANAKSAYSALLDEFALQPDVLFIALTAPPLIRRSDTSPLWKHMARKILGRPGDNTASGPLAREFNNWLKSEAGWLRDYSHKNVIVFDYYDILTENGASDFLRFPSGPASNDNHPSSVGNTKAADAFVPFLNGAVRYAGLLD